MASLNLLFHDQLGAVEWLGALALYQKIWKESDREIISGIWHMYLSSRTTSSCVEWDNGRIDKGVIRMKLKNTYESSQQADQHIVRNHI